MVLTITWNNIKYSSHKHKIHMGIISATTFDSKYDQNINIQLYSHNPIWVQVWITCGWDCIFQNFLYKNMLSLWCNLYAFVLQTWIWRRGDICIRWKDECTCTESLSTEVYIAIYQVWCNQNGCNTDLQLWSTFLPPKFVDGSLMLSDNYKIWNQGSQLYFHLKRFLQWI